METIRGYQIFTSNKSTKQRASVTVRNSKGQIAARVYADKGKMLARIRTVLYAPERLELMAKLAEVGIPEDDILVIVNGRED